jgi:hypothetical protein
VYGVFHAGLGAYWAIVVMGELGRAMERLVFYVSGSCMYVCVYVVLRKTELLVLVRWMGVCDLHLHCWRFRLVFMNLDDNGIRIDGLMYDWIARYYLYRWL